MPKWSAFEKAKVIQMRERLGSQLTDRPQFPEVVGDRRILRFLRGYDYDVDKAAEMMSKFLTWRIEKGVDEIRQNILLGGMNRPELFPKGEIISRLVKSVILTPYNCDNTDHPLVVDQYGFNPDEVRSAISIEDNIVFVIYTLEYRALVCEQLSEEREQAYLQSLSEEDRARALYEPLVDPNDPSLQVPPAQVADPMVYGITVMYTVIRDIGALGMSHMGGNGREIISAVISIASNNYPEVMFKTYVINSSWIFNTLWWFIQGLLAAKTIAKVQVLGYDFMTTIADAIPIDRLPTLVGGTYEEPANYVFPFNKEYLDPNSGVVAAGSTVEINSLEVAAVESVSVEQVTVDVKALAVKEDI